MILYSNSVSVAAVVNACTPQRSTGYRTRLNMAAARPALESGVHTIHQRLANGQVVVTMRFDRLAETKLPNETIQLAAVYIVMALHRCPVVRKHGLIAFVDFADTGCVMILPCAL